MADIQIASIRDTQMQTIAKRVDNNNDNILNDEEISLFAQEATKAGIDYKTISETLDMNAFQRWINDVDKVCTDGKDDGKLGFGETLESLGKGFAGIVKAAVDKPFITAGALAVATGLTALTGGAILPVMVAAGATIGTGMIGFGAYNAATAKTDTEAKQAWETIGTGAFSVASSAVAAKSALGQAYKVGVYSGKGANEMSTTKALAQCFKSTPESIKVALTNAKDALHYNWSAYGTPSAHWKDANGNAGAVGEKDYDILHSYLYKHRSQAEPNYWTDTRPTKTTLDKILNTTKDQGLSTKMQNLLKANLDPNSEIYIHSSRAYRGFGTDQANIEFSHFNLNVYDKINPTSLNNSAIIPVVTTVTIGNEINEYNQEPLDKDIK